MRKKTDYGLTHSRNRAVNAAGLCCAARGAVSPQCCSTPGPGNGSVLLQDVPVFQWLRDSFCPCRQEWFPISQSSWDKMSQCYGSPINIGANTTKYHRALTRFHSRVSQRIQLCAGEFPKELVSVFCRIPLQEIVSNLLRYMVQLPERDGWSWRQIHKFHCGPGLTSMKSRPSSKSDPRYNSLVLKAIIRPSTNIFYSFLHCQQSEPFECLQPAGLPEHIAFCVVLKHKCPLHLPRPTE